MITASNSTSPQKFRKFDGFSRISMPYLTPTPYHLPLGRVFTTRLACYPASRPVQKVHTTRAMQTIQKYSKKFGWVSRKFHPTYLRPNAITLEQMRLSE